MSLRPTQSPIEENIDQVARTAVSRKLTSQWQDDAEPKGARRNQTLATVARSYRDSSTA